MIKKMLWILQVFNPLVGTKPTRHWRPSSCPEVERGPREFESNSHNGICIETNQLRALVSIMEYRSFP